METTQIKLTQFSRGAGCGCKISPQQLEEILRSDIKTHHPSLMVGNDSRDDAAVFDMKNGTAMISTTDFFMPIVDDAFDFGKIAAANSISDVYAMGGKPLMAIAILGWPVDKLPAELAATMLDGARHTCKEAGIPLAGGHSIDTIEPLFGLAVTGIIKTGHLKKNNTAKPGDLIFLTKALGTGILSTAQKRGVIQADHIDEMTKNMSMLNRVGENLGEIEKVTSMTDVTGFGLAGHLVEMLKGSDASGLLFYNRIKILNGVTQYISQKMIPDATYRNWNSYSDKVQFEKGVNVLEAFSLLPDPQTNGGLLFTASPDSLKDIVELLMSSGLADFTQPIGEVIERKEKLIYVTNA